MALETTSRLKDKITTPKCSKLIQVCAFSLFTLFAWWEIHNAHARDRPVANEIKMNLPELKKYSLEQVVLSWILSNKNVEAINSSYIDLISDSFVNRNVGTFEFLTRFIEKWRELGLNDNEITKLFEIYVNKKIIPFDKEKLIWSLKKYYGEDFYEKFSELVEIQKTRPITKDDISSVFKDYNNENKDLDWALNLWLIWASLLLVWILLKSNKK